MSRADLSTIDSGAFVDQIVWDGDLGKELKVSTRYLRKLRDNGDGPEYLRIGRRVFYKRSVIERWKAARSFKNSAHEMHARQLRKIRSENATA